MRTAAGNQNTNGSTVGMVGSMVKRQNKLKTRVHTFALPCENKTQFKSEAAALEGAELRMADHLSLEISVYQCTACNLWHLTRSSSKNTRKTIIHS